MKLYKKILGISLITLSITACKNNFFSEHIACDNKEALSLVNEVLKNDLTNTLEHELKALISDGQIKDLDPTKLKLSAQSINFTLIDSRTEFIDPNSPKTTCSIDLSTVLPSDLVKKSDEARAQVDRYSTESQAHDLNVDFENNKIKLTLEYTLQPTDKGDKMFASVKNSANLNTLISDTLTYAFLKPQIEKNQIRLKETQEKQIEDAARAVYNKNNAAPTTADDTEYVEAQAANEYSEDY